MTPKALLAEEQSRLSELWSYDIVDTGPDPRFDEIVRLAAQVCRAPLAAISLVEANRLWFKARLGLVAEEMNREGSFCDRVVTSREPLIVGNALQDGYFRGSALVCGAAGVRAYAGYPLESPAGAVVGSLCVIDTEAREWSVLECEALRVLAAQVIAQLELRRANAELLQLWEERRVLESRSLAGRRDDQRQLAAELHDGLGQDLTGISLLVKTLRGQSGERSTREELLKIEQLTRSAIETCRRLARGQTAFGFVHGSLRESLEQYLAGVNEMSGLRCDLEWSPTIALRDRTASYNLYRIAQEAVTNAMRHSGGHSIRVRVSERGARLLLEIEDDGTGLAAGHGRESGREGGVGLETMRYRASAIGARLELRPGEPHGLVVSCELPLARAA